MRKIIALLLAAIMVFTLLTACGKKNETVEPEAETTFVPETEDIVIEKPTEEELPVETQPEETEKEPEQAPQEIAPSEPVEPVSPEVPEEKPEEPATPPAEPEQEQTEETPAPQIPSETPILPPAASTEKEPAETPAAKNLTEIIDEIYKINDPILPAMSIPVDLTDAYSLSSYTGLSDASLILEAVASESMMGAQAYSLVLVRLKDAADAQTVAQAMRNGIDQRKWICVHADDIRVVASEDVVMLCMIASNLDVKVSDMVSAFATVMGSGFTADIS